MQTQMGGGHRGNPRTLSACVFGGGAIQGCAKTRTPGLLARLRRAKGISTFRKGEGNHTLGSIASSKRLQKRFVPFAKTVWTELCVESVQHRLSMPGA